MKKTGILGLILVVIAGVGALAMSDKPSGSWRYKMSVVVETPEGEITGSAVREMGNSTPLIQLPDVGNPAGVRGEAVVVDLGARGVLFALISDKSDNEFYMRFRCRACPKVLAALLPRGLNITPLCRWARRGF